MELGALEGWTVGVTADRRAPDQIDLLEQHGATVVHAPAVRSVFLGDEEGQDEALDPNEPVLRIATGRYRWTPPAEPLRVVALLEAVIAGEVDGVTFTSAPALQNTIDLAREHDLETALLGVSDLRVVVVSPAASVAAQDAGMRVTVAPSQTQAALVRTLARELGRGRRHLHLASGQVVVQGRAILVDGVPGRLSRLERLVLEALADARGGVVLRDELEIRVWGNVSSNGHRVHVTMGRLRRRLGNAARAIQPVHGRGYRLTA